MKRIITMTAVVGTLITALVFACSSSESVAESPDAGDAEADRRSPPRDAGVEEVAPSCEPQPLTRATRYVPPRPWHQPACEPAQVKGYVKSCVFGSDSVCQAFFNQNPGCAACAETREAESTWGALVVYEGGYSNTNFAGCVANALGDLSPDGCGAAMARVVDCASHACRSCLPVTTQDEYDRFDACSDEKKVGDICAEDIARMNVKCAGHTKADQASPTYPCYAVGLSNEAYVEHFVSLFCTVPTDGGLDAGPDAEDAATD